MRHHSNLMYTSTLLYTLQLMYNSKWMCNSQNNWDRRIKFPGWKMYMNSVQADIALRNLKKLVKKPSLSILELSIYDFYGILCD